jgi:dTDP-4-dehydrorhamnose 3,5-epimerase
MIKTAKKDAQVVSEDWSRRSETIQGVQVKEVRHVPGNHGVVTEVFRPEWDPTGLPVVHAYQARLFPGVIGAWSCHTKTVDRLFVNQGNLKAVLYDGREESPTYKLINEIYLGDARPAFLVIPAGVWHGLQNLGAGDALILNMPTHAYDYKDPDRWRLPWDTTEIPYHWSGQAPVIALQASGHSSGK